MDVSRKGNIDAVRIVKVMRENRKQQKKYKKNKTDSAFLWCEPGSRITLAHFDSAFEEPAWERGYGRLLGGRQPPTVSHSRPKEAGGNCFFIYFYISFFFFFTNSSRIPAAETPQRDDNENQREKNKNIKKQEKKTTVHTTRQHSKRTRDVHIRNASGSLSRGNRDCPACAPGPRCVSPFKRAPQQRPSDPTHKAPPRTKRSVCREEVKVSPASLDLTLRPAQAIPKHSM